VDLAAELLGQSVVPHDKDAGVVAGQRSDHPFDFHVVQGGTVSNAIPDFCRIEVDARFDHASDLELLKQQSGGVQQAAQAAAAGNPSQLMAIMDQLMHSKEGAELVGRIESQAKKAGLG